MAMNKDDGELLADKVNGFLLANKKTIFGIIALVVVVVIGCAFYFSLSNKKKADDIASVEKIIFDLNKAKENFEKKKKEAEEEAKKKAEVESSENNSAEDGVKQEKSDDVVEDKGEEKKDPELLAKEDEVIPELEKVGASSTGYASYLAFYNVADIYFFRKDYAKAKDYYLKALDAVQSGYVSGVLLFNVAVCVEEIGENDAEALDFYQKAANVEDFPLKPRAIFNVARLYEKMGKIEEAISTYNSIIEKYPNNDFAMIGKSRIINLEIKSLKD